ncbi:MAG: putative sulfate exporter family transporter [Saprospiraceae bacterium]|nr:putative sulfate exporter family transporter [Saprospiraceae bacterium]MDG1432849.1 putative sulfate exporter family transporter [Saprospiraceae bacterium]MDG2417541.1 putative sulfate exporter family transporter [Saprospiraceae bacterium]
MKKSHFLISHEDYWSIWIGGFVLMVGLFLFFINAPKDYVIQHEKYEAIQAEERAKAPFKTIKWYDAFRSKQKIKASSETIGKFFKKLTSKPSSWNSNPLESFHKSALNFKDAKKELAIKLVNAVEETKLQKRLAEETQVTAAKSKFENIKFNMDAEIAIEKWYKSRDRADKIRSKSNASNLFKVGWMLLWFVILNILFLPGIYYLGKKRSAFAKGFAFVFLIAILAYLFGAQVNMKAMGIGYAAWAIILGLLISNTLGTPEWVKPALQTSWFIKTGLVLLGAEVLFNKVLAIGLPGIFVAWVVTPVVLISTYMFGQKVLKIKSKTLNMVISADMSVCGVSAAVATAAACNAKKEELTLAIGLSMTFTSVMMIILPMIIKALGMPEVLGGAWIGGTIDATGAVVAAGEFLGDKALSVAATIKMIQNVLIGIIAFGVAVYFTAKVDVDSSTEKVKVGLSEIWKRFPKFILGFIGASILFTLIYVLLGDNHAYTIIDQGVIGGLSKNVRGWLFCLAFVSIGLSTNFVELKYHFSGGKPLILYVVGQIFNLLLTLLVAYIMFYLVFPDVATNL